MTTCPGAARCGWRFPTCSWTPTSPSSRPDPPGRSTAAYSLEELDAILAEEVYPACAFNLRSVAGEWAGFDADWLEGLILCGGAAPRPWWRRWGRYLMPGWTIPVRLPPEWAEWRAEVARLRQRPEGSMPSNA